MEQTLYRKYRPNHFAQLAGQEHIKRLFSKSLQEDSYAHAYIFAGPRGTGKTTVARIVAKRLNCLNPINNEPCNECSQCKAINEGSHIDVIEMDAASNRGIDDFRAVRDRVAYRPVQGKVKVYIIDEVHMLTNEAFNAILKTLEEPPEHVVFILATTNPEKIPETIISRCQIIPFRNVAVQTIIEHLQMIATNEGYTVSEDVFSYISKRAKGSMRDAIVLLEQVLRFLPKEQTISKAEILQVLGDVDDEEYFRFINLIKNNEASNIIEFSEHLYNDGINFEVFLDGLTDYILTQFSIKNVIFDQKLLLRIAKKSSELIKQIKYSDNPNIIFSVEFLNFSENNIVQGTNQQIENKQHKQSPLTKKVSNPIPSNEEFSTIKNLKDSIDKNGLPDDLLKEMKERDMDLYMALLYLKNEIVEEGTVTISKNKSYPFSNYVIEMKEKALRSYFNNYSLKVIIQEDKEESIQQIKQDDNLNEKKVIPVEVKGIYEKLQKLFPGSEIVIKDNKQ
ncbi:MAG TPA: DNA polymerase III subunit gamma/tau [Bacteroidales bacterium]|nr:DNA polymerase III subunit gamma/tau [Bacteroidales bacterium]HRW35264.1 DNA polymerase III subunit gamma/tau [Thermotogota bacterium]